MRQRHRGGLDSTLRTFSRFAGYGAGTTSSVKEVNEPVLELLTVSVIFSVHLPSVLVPS